MGCKGAIRPKERNVRKFEGEIRAKEKDEGVH